jgi:metallo-beta-lactamase class B
MSKNVSGRVSSRAGWRVLAMTAYVIVASTLLATYAAAQTLTIPPRADNRNEKKEPFRVIGNIYWVGHTQIGSFLIKTPQGDILMDTTSAEQAPWVRENLDKLGIKMKDIKIMLNSHPHAEHMGGFAMFKELTGAKIITSKLTADEMATGGRTDFREDGSEQYKPVRADQTVADGGKVELGGVTLVAHITPGHTKGCTTWTTTVEEDGKPYNVVFFCGVTPAGPDRAPLFNNPKYPNLVSDFEHTFEVLKSLPCDVFLYARATTVKVDEKEARLKRGEKPNPFIDPQGCKDYIAENETMFQKLLTEQRAALNKTP